MPATITDACAFTPIGLSPLQTAMCARTGAFQPRTVALQDRRQRAMGMCLVGGLGANVHGYDRMVALAAGALGSWAALDPATAIPLVVAIPEAGRADDDARFATHFARDVAARAGITVDHRRAAVVRRDRAGIGDAILLAQRWHEEGATRVIVGGVDSHYHPEVLRTLDRDHRLHAMGANDGFVPAEAAAFFLLDRRPDQVGTTLDAVVTGDDSAARLDAPLDGPPDIAQTMTSLLQQLAATHGRPRWVITDENGEAHRRRWWRLTSRRETLDPEVDALRLPSVMGDVGAATGAVAVAVAHASWQAACAASRRCCVALHGENGERSAILLSAPEETS